MKRAEVIVTQTTTWADAKLFNGTRLTLSGELADVQNILQTRFDLSRDLAKEESHEVERVQFVPLLHSLITLTKNGQPIAAIKRLRELTDLDLKSAKELIDSIGHSGWVR